VTVLRLACGRRRVGGVEGVWVQSELLERVTAVRLVVVVSTVVVDVVREGCLFGQGRVAFWWWSMEGLASGSVCASGGEAD
jgi:hypothetical protein